eukprot:TRINITY_DN86_c0_g1_i4.p1 TRINITY_DN86_c0_g1~~TRINITY_DN86_c0_g1_i4.p1  ORF type:complete len:111 (+),score=0.91 TRINITY_DN86_c0_g1_i4:804-1136(+)
MSPKFQSGLSYLAEPPGPSICCCSLLIAYYPFSPGMSPLFWGKEFWTTFPLRRGSSLNHLYISQPFFQSFGLYAGASFGARPLERNGWQRQAKDSQRWFIFLVAHQVSSP